MLDVAFKYDSRVEAPRSLEQFFYNLGRRPDQTLLSYCADHRERQREVEKHGIKVSDEISGWLLLRRAGLTAEQRQLVLSQLKDKTTVIKVEEVMYFLFGQDYKTSSKQWHRQSNNSWKQYRGSQRAYHFDEQDEIADDEAYVYDDTATYEHMPEYDETALYEADESLYPEDIPEEFYDGSEQGLWEQEEGDEDMEEAYSMYLDARKRFAELRAARGYWPVVALPPESQGQSSSSSPPSTGGLVKGKSKGKGKGASKGK